MRAWVYGVMVLLGVGVLWVLSGTQHAASVLPATPGMLGSLEMSVAAHPDDAEGLRMLAQAYLDAGQPGLARALLEGAPTSVRAEPRAQHVLARALLEQGRSDLALEVEAAVLAACRPSGADRLAPTCDPVLFASAVRRTNILQEAVAMGVRDFLAHPEASAIAYQNATREARVSLE